MKFRMVVSLLIVVALTVFFSGCGSNSGTSKPVAPSEWTWANGADVVNQRGVYGTQGTAAASNVPGARQQAVTWGDRSGNLWLFGGFGLDSSGNSNYMNDLWEYSAGQWTWMGGLNVGGQSGIYGILGTVNPNNVPGARWGSVSWADASGNLWLFGGYGYGAYSGGVDILNDVWEFTPGQNSVGQPYVPGQWTWMGGSSLNGQPGTYGTLGTPAAGNIPGARYGAVSWMDASGNVWLFGGNGCALPGDLGNLNDLWRYSAGEWTWMSGSDLADQVGTYGSLGTPGASNIPGGRFSAVSWTDASGNFWVFGGAGQASTGSGGLLNDLWKYSAGQWTWEGGSNLNGQSGTYGSLGTAAASNIPGARSGAIGWRDSSGNLWLFGGAGQDSAGNGGWLNDLWEYSGGQWTWIGGSDVNGQLGTYGNQGTGAVGNVPGARTLGVGWTDMSGNFWLFGGSGFDSMGGQGYLNDFWQFQP